MTVGTSATELDPSGLPDSRESGIIVVLQNLGPGDVYFDFDGAVTTGTGVKIAAGGGYELPRASARPLWVVSDQAGTDLRYVGID